MHRDSFIIVIINLLLISVYTSVPDIPNQTYSFSKDKQDECHYLCDQEHKPDNQIDPHSQTANQNRSPQKRDTNQSQNKQTGALDSPSTQHRESDSRLTGDNVSNENSNQETHQGSRTSNNNGHQGEVWLSLKSRDSSSSSLLSSSSSSLSNVIIVDKSSHHRSNSVHDFQNSAGNTGASWDGKDPPVFSSSADVNTDSQQQKTVSSGSISHVTPTWRPGRLVALTTTAQSVVAAVVVSWLVVWLRHHCYYYMVLITTLSYDLS